jgi:hypothetical protein
MTNQTLVSNRPSNLSSGNLTGSTPQLPAALTAPYQARLLEAMKSQYQLDQQAKFLDLQAETELLLRQLQAIKEQRQAALNSCV